MTNNKSRFWSILALLVIVVGIGYLLRFDPYGWQDKPEVQQATDEDVVVEETVSNDDGADAEAESVAEQSGADDVDVAAASQTETADAATQGGVPSFSLLRVEPDGSTVVAGSAAPGVMLEVFSGDTVLAKTEVGPSGDFVTVFDDPLPPGDYEIGLRSRGDADMVMLSEEIATVSVPEEDSRELMVMVTKPGEPSRLLDQPEAVADASGDENMQSDAVTAESETSSDTVEKETAAAETSSEPAGETAATSEAGAPAQDSETVTAAEEEAVAAADVETSGEENAEVASASETSNQQDAASESAMTSDATSTIQEETSAVASTEEQSTAVAAGAEATETTKNAAAEVAEAEPEKGAAQDKPVETAMAEKQDDKVETAAAAPKADESVNSTETAQNAVNADSASTEKEASEPLKTAAMTEKSEVAADPEGSAAAAPKADESVNSTETAQNAVNADSASTEKEVSEPLKTAAMTEKSEVAAEPEGSADAAPGEDTGETQTEETIEVASRDKGKSERPAASADIRVRIDAVEIENGQLFVAGSGTPGGKVIVFADNDAVGESMISATGRFLVEAQKELSVGDHTIRADLYLQNGSAAAMRVAVPFNRPEGNMVAAVAPQPNADEEPVSDNEETAISDAGADEEQTALEGSADEAVVVKAPAAKTASEAEAEAEPMSTETMAKTDVKPTETQTEMKSDTDQKTVAELDSAAPAVETVKEPAVTNVPKTTEPVEEKMAAAEPKSEPEIKKVAVAGEEGEPPTVVQPPLEQHDSSVIIRRGDTLWQISRRVYGRGVRYTTIYLANTDQIRNPDFIEPGQTFMVPEKPLPNAEQLHRDRVLKR